MPLLDMSSVLDSPIFSDSFTVNRRTQTVGSNGRATTATQAVTPVSGAVYPSDENELQRFPDLQITEKALTVITRFALRSESEVAGTEFSPDIVVWPLGGDKYLVRKIEDWSQYGTGFIFAICTAIDTVNQPPVTE